MGACLCLCLCLCLRLSVCVCVCMCMCVRPGGRVRGRLCVTRVVCIFVLSVWHLGRLVDSHEDDSGDEAKDVGNKLCVKVGLAPLRNGLASRLHTLSW